MAFGSLAVEAEILRLSVGPILTAGCGVMAAAGGLYGGIFRRGANDPRGGWLFGMAYGFLLWIAGAVLILPLLSGGRAPAGTAAVGVFLSFLVWDAATGGLSPHVHRLLHISMDLADVLSHAGLGPAAAAVRASARHPIFLANSQEIDMVEMKPDVPPAPPPEELAHGEVVVTPNESQPYKVVFQIGDVTISEHPVSSVEEGEALIKEELPQIRAAARGKTREA